MLQALTAKHSQFEEDIALFQKDDLLAWLARKTSKPTAASVNIPSPHLAELIRRNAAAAILRMRQIAPPEPADPNQNPQNGAYHLVAQATDVKNLCKMDATWAPWF